MAIRIAHEPDHDTGAAFRDRVRLLGRTDRRHDEAVRVRVHLARAGRMGLRERLARVSDLRDPASA
jgi:hypothetical protein